MSAAMNPVEDVGLHAPYVYRELRERVESRLSRIAERDLPAHARAAGALRNDAAYSIDLVRALSMLTAVERILYVTPSEESHPEERKR